MTDNVQIMDAGDESVNASVQRAPHSMSATTRLLSAGAYIDPDFAEEVIEELIEKKHRFVAPSYGYNVLPVLGHALIARDRHRLVRAGIVFSPVILVMVLGGLHSVILGILLALWFAWGTVFLYRLTGLQILTRRLKESYEGKLRFDGSTPPHPLLTPDTRERILREQDSALGVVYYGGYRPFIGAGEKLKTTSFAILLKPAEARKATNGLGGDEMTAHVLADLLKPAKKLKAIKEFTSDEMMAHVQTELDRVLHTDVTETQQIQTLEITRRWYRTAIGRWRPDPQAQAQQPARQGEERYASAREYLCVRVGTWEQELVNSFFISFDIRGQTLYTEMHYYVLYPVRSDFHGVDRLPEVITPRKVVKLAVESFQSLLSYAFSPFLRLLLPAVRKAIKSAKMKIGNNLDDEDLEDLEDDSSVDRDEEIKNFGARRSVRELGQSAKLHHFFQWVDARKYMKIVERRTHEIIIDYLESKDVDTSEYRARQAEILNNGIIQTGSGQIISQGNMAMGQNTDASSQPNASSENQ